AGVAAPRRRGAGPPAARGQGVLDQRARRPRPSLPAVPRPDTALVARTGSFRPDMSCAVQFLVACARNDVSAPTCGALGLAGGQSCERNRYGGAGRPPPPPPRRPP